ncbi:MAG: glycosyltransferase [Bdellovibrionota bacterium]|nr:glycosyltransferase [Bdellovibrionota bacterium]
MITLRSDIGGGPKHLYDLANNLSSTTVYIAAPLEEPFGEKFKALSEKFFPLKHRSFSLLTLMRLVYFCKNEDIDIVHSHGRGAGLYSRLISFFGMKVVHTFHGAHFEDTIVGRVKLMLDKILKYACDDYICVSNDEYIKAKELAIIGNNKVSVINNGVSIPREQEPLVLDVDEEDIVFGTLARLSYQKGIDILLNELATHDFPKNWKFLIAGSGEDQAKIENLIKEKELENNVKLMGKTTKPLRFLSSIDIYFSTSRWEGLPIAVLEAMSLSKPCVLSNVDGHKVLDRSEYSVLLYEDFVESCKKVINEKDKYAAGAMKCVKENFSLEKMCRETEQVYYE